MKNVKHTISRIMLCLMLSIGLVLPMAVPTEVLAAAGTASTKAAAVEGTDTAEVSNEKSSKKQYISGINIVFSKKVLSKSKLKYAPSKITAKGQRKSIKLSWTPASDTSKISGYYIVRWDSKTNNWYQIATVSKKLSTYTDKTAKTKNKYYRYTIVAYKKSNGNIKVSNACRWAGAITTRSSKKNVYSVAPSNLANVSILMAGSCAQTYLSFNKKAFTKYTRWYSSDKSVATVDSTGLITGIAPGTATIYMQTHTGNYSSFNITVCKGGTANSMIQAFNAWMGFSRLNGKHKGIIDIYNSVTPWPVGYKMRYSDAWCDATITAAAIKTGNVDIIGRECSVPRHIKIFQALGIWEEDGTITPNPGDIIVYSWRKFRQPNNASASHIGLVVEVENGEITCIEGNRGIGIVDTRTIPVGWGCIRGYARPHYNN